MCKILYYYHYNPIVHKLLDFDHRCQSTGYANKQVSLNSMDSTNSPDVGQYRSKGASAHVGAQPPLKCERYMSPHWSLSPSDITVTLDWARLGVSKALQWALWQLVRCDLSMSSSSKFWCMSISYGQWYCYCPTCFTACVLCLRCGVHRLGNHSYCLFFIIVLSVAM